jgi:hypothetical protein
MELDDLPRARPHAFAAVRAPFVDNGDLRLLKFDGVLGTDTHATAAEVALPGDDVDHERSGTGHGALRKL